VFGGERSEKGKKTILHGSINKEKHLPHAVEFGKAGTGEVTGGGGETAKPRAGQPTHPTQPPPPPPRPNHPASRFSKHPRSAVATFNPTKEGKKSWRRWRGQLEKKGGNRKEEEDLDTEFQGWSGWQSRPRTRRRDHKKN